MPRLTPGCFVIGQPPGHATDMMPKPKCTMIFKLMFELNRTSGCKLRFETRCELFDSKCELTCKSKVQVQVQVRADMQFQGRIQVHVRDDVRAQAQT